MEVNNIQIATKFVTWDVTDLHKLKETKVYKLREKLNNKLKLTREEKNFITENVNNNTFFRNAIPLAGWRFDFSDILKTYIVKQYNYWREYNAVDKTSLRKYIYGRIEKIVEIK